MKISRNVCSKMWTDLTIDLKSKTFKHCCKQLPYKPNLADIKTLGKDFFINYDLNIKNRKQMLFENELPESCAFCKYQGENSIKHVWNSWTDEYINQNENVLLYEDQTFYIEIDIGNSCNLACIYCGPWSSTTWEKELNIKNSTSNNEEYNALVLKLLVEWIKTFPKNRKLTINMLGGEPLMIPETYAIIEKLIPACKKFDYKPKMMITTNLYTKPKLLDRLFEILEKTSGVFSWEFSISIEDIGERAEMVRYGLNWKVFEDNVGKIIDKVDYIYFTNTINIVSLPYFDEWIEWAFNKMQSKKFGHNWLLSCNYVQDNFTDCAYIPRDLIKLSFIKEKFLSHIQKNNISTETSRVKEFIQHIDNIEGRLGTKIADDNFVKFWRDLSNRRKLDYIERNDILKKIIKGM